MAAANPGSADDLRRFLLTFAESVRVQASWKLAAAFTMPDASLDKSAASFLSTVDIDGAVAQIAVGACEPFAELLGLHLRSRVEATAGRPREAYALQKDAADKLLNVLQGEDNWLCPLLYAVLRNLRVTAVKADDATRRSVAADAGRKKRSRAEPTQCLNDSVQALLAAFRQTISDRAPEARSKKKGTINVAVNLFKVYFRLDKASKCTEVWKVIDKLPRFPTLESFPLSHSVPYSYDA